MSDKTKVIHGAKPVRFSVPIIAAALAGSSTFSGAAQPPTMARLPTKLTPLPAASLDLLQDITLTLPASTYSAENAGLAAVPKRAIREQTGLTGRTERLSAFSDGAKGKPAFVPRSEAEISAPVAALARSRRAHADPLVGLGAGPNLRDIVPERGAGAKPEANSVSMASSDLSARILANSVQPIVGVQSAGLNTIEGVGAAGSPASIAPFAAAERDTGRPLGVLSRGVRADAGSDHDALDMSVLASPLPLPALVRSPGKAVRAHIGGNAPQTRISEAASASPARPGSALALDATLAPPIQPLALSNEVQADSPVGLVHGLQPHDGAQGLAVAHPRERLVSSDLTDRILADTAQTIVQTAPGNSKGSFGRSGEETAIPQVAFTLPARVNDKPAGSIQLMILDNSNISVNLADILTLLKSKIDPQRYDWLRHAPAAQSNITLNDLRAAGIPVRFGADDELIIG